MESTTVVTAFGPLLPYLVWSHMKPNNCVLCTFTVQISWPNKHQFSYSFVCLMCQKSVVRNVSPSVTPLVTSIIFFDSQYSTFHHQNPHLSCAYYAISPFLTGHFYSFLYSCNGSFFNPYILMCLSAMQHLQPEDVYPEFSPQPQSFHPDSCNRRWSLTGLSILDPHIWMNRQLMHLKLGIPTAFLLWWIKGSLQTRQALCHNIVPHTLALLLAHWLVLLMFHVFRQLALHKATTILVSSTSNPQRIQGKPRWESRVVALPHPGSAKVRITYRTRKCTDQFHACYVTASSIPPQLRCSRF